MAALQIVVTGLAATYPFGGIFWDYLQYVVGLRRLGHEVLYVEDSGRWCYDPRQRTFVQDSERNAAYLAGHSTAKFLTGAARFRRLEHRALSPRFAPRGTTG